MSRKKIYKKKSNMENISKFSITALAQVFIFHYLTTFTQTMWIFFMAGKK